LPQSWAWAGRDFLSLLCKFCCGFGLGWGWLLVLKNEEEERNCSFTAGKGVDISEKLQDRRHHME